MRIGVFGGTFDPIHNAHLFVAESARLLERLDRVLFVPTGNTPLSRQAAGRCRASMRDDSGCDRKQRSFRARSIPICAITPPDIPPICCRACRRSTPSPRSPSSSAPTRWPMPPGCGSTRCSKVARAFRYRAARRCRHRRARARHRRRSAGSARPRHARSIFPELPESATLVRSLLSQGRSVRYLVPEPVWRVYPRLTAFMAMTAMRARRRSPTLIAALAAIAERAAPHAVRPTIAHSATRIRPHVRTSKSSPDGNVTAALGRAAGPHQSARRLSPHLGSGCDLIVRVEANTDFTGPISTCAWATTSW